MTTHAANCMFENCLMPNWRNVNKMNKYLIIIVWTEIYYLIFYDIRKVAQKCNIFAHKFVMDFPLLRRKNKMCVKWWQHSHEYRHSHRRNHISSLQYNITRFRFHLHSLLAHSHRQFYAYQINVINESCDKILFNDKSHFCIAI